MQADYGTAVLFWGNQCKHYSTPNTCTITRVSLDFRVVRADDFIGDYIHPSKTSAGGTSMCNIQCVEPCAAITRAMR
jgi:hypothetical protein